MAQGGGGLRPPGPGSEPVPPGSFRLPAKVRKGILAFIAAESTGRITLDVKEGHILHGRLEIFLTSKDFELLELLDDNEEMSVTFKYP